MGQSRCRCDVDESGEFQTLDVSELTNGAPPIVYARRSEVFDAPHASLKELARFRRCCTARKQQPSVATNLRN